MAKFKGFILTEKGRELLAKGLAGETITFTKMAIGDGTTATSEREMTALVNQITTLPLLNVDTKGNGTCEINALLTNKSVTTGFYIRELGIFAHGNDNVEILYAYNTSANADYLPPFSANNVVEIEYIDTIIVDQVENITATIDPTISYITKKYAEDNFLTLKDKMKMLGLEFGGNIQDIGNKTKGKFYYDSVTKFYYECIEDNSLTYNDSGKFRAISNKPISDKLENLFTFGKNWIKFPFGLTIQWGANTAPNGNDLINLNTPFESTDYQIVVSDDGPGTHVIGTVPVTNEAFKLFGTDPGSLKYTKTGFRWLAVGF